MIMIIVVIASIVLSTYYGLSIQNCLHILTYLNLTATM